MLKPPLVDATVSHRSGLAGPRGRHGRSQHGRSSPFRSASMDPVSDRTSHPEDRRPLARRRAAGPCRPDGAAARGDELGRRPRGRGKEVPDRRRPRGPRPPRRPGALRRREGGTCGHKARGLARRATTSIAATTAWRMTRCTIRSSSDREASAGEAGGRSLKRCTVRRRRLRWWPSSPPCGRCASGMIAGWGSCLRTTPSPVRDRCPVPGRAMRSWAFGRLGLSRLGVVQGHLVGIACRRCVTTTRSGRHPRKGRAHARRTPRPRRETRRLRQVLPHAPSGRQAFVS